MSCVCPHCHCFPLGDHLWWVSSGHGEGNKKRKRSNAIGVQLAAARRAPNRVMVAQDSTPPRSKSTSGARGTAGNVWQFGKCAQAFWRPAERWNYAAVKIRDLEKETRSKKVVKPNFTTDYPGAFIREGADELTLRADEEEVVRSFIDTTNVGNKRWGPPLVHEDWHVFCQATFQGSRRTGVGSHVLSTQGAAPSG